MKTIHLYISREFLMTAAVAVGVLTFALVGARVIKEVFELVSQGVPLSFVFWFMVYSLPMILSLTLPFGILVATILVFGRMSADNEITAMRACGISVLQIISPMIIFTVAFTCLSLWLQLVVGPQFAGEAKDLMKQVAVEHPIALLKSSEDNELGDYIVNVSDIDKDGRMKGIQIFEFSSDKSWIRKDITAQTGVIELDREQRVMNVILFKANYQDYEAPDAVPKRGISEKIQIPFRYDEEFNRRRLTLKPRYMLLEHLFGRIMLEMRRGRDFAYLLVELNKRIALGLSPLSFLLLGIPLAIRTSRRETSVGLFLSVVLGGVYYFSIILFEILGDHPNLYPHVLLWIPNIGYQVGGCYFIWRISRK
jgi:lipopolysaccharide export system permease protein